VNPVVNPLPGSSIGHNTTVTQCRKMTRDFWLYYTQGMDEFADAHFALLLNQHQATQACVIGQKLKEMPALHLHADVIYGTPYIRSTICFLVAAISGPSPVSPFRASMVAKLPGPRPTLTESRPHGGSCGAQIKPLMLAHLPEISITSCEWRLLPRKSSMLRSPETH